MPNYVYIGQAPAFYPDIITGAGSLIAVPGDVRTFEDEAPSDGNWLPTDAPEVIPAPRSWPIVADQAQPDEAAPEAPQPLNPGDAQVGLTTVTADPSVPQFQFQGV